MAQFGCARASSSVAAAIRSADQSPKGTSRCREGHPLDRRGPVGVSEGLEDGIVLAVERQKRCTMTFRCRHDGCARTNQRLLIGKSDGSPGLDGGECRPHAGRAGDGPDHEIARTAVPPLRRPSAPAATGDAGARPGRTSELHSLLASARAANSSAEASPPFCARAAASRPPAMAATLKASRMQLQDLGSRAADRTGSAEDHERLRGGEPDGALVRNRSSCGASRPQCHVGPSPLSAALPRPHQAQSAKGRQPPRKRRPR